MRTVKIPQLKSMPVTRRGDRLYGVGNAQQHTGGPGEPPPGFVTAKTSAPEWMVYWGLSRIFMTPSPAHVRDYPFDGGWPYWTYQSFAETGGAQETNIDFVIWSTAALGTPVGIRVLGAFSHDPTNSEQMLHDLTQRVNLEENYDVVDLRPEDFQGDSSGQAVILHLKSLLLLIEPPNPSYMHVRRPRA
jgi:hypothetical protein